MLQQIVIRTPVWVWPLLAFLIYRGFIASLDREVAFRKTFIIPLVMLALSIQGIVSGFSASPYAAPVWLAFLAVGSMLAWLGSDPAGMQVHPQRRTIRLRGSWVPMVLMMSIFLTKYVVGVMVAMHPDLRQNAAFVATICALYGIFNGIFTGKLLRIVAVYRQGLAGVTV